jgi:chemotaxis protein methyltransferase CheR
MLSDAEFAIIAREVKVRSGAVLAAELNGPAEMRLQPLARRENFASVSELIAAARIRPDGALWNAMADALAQSETRFFRDRAIFERLRSELIPDAFARRGHERVRIWSGACATGQEPYSVAMIIEEMRADGLNPAAEIIATDMSERLLDKARAGLYTQFEVQRGLPIRKLISYFEKSGDLWRISDRLRAAVKFERHNLLKHPGQFGQFDIILMRHVLTHFDADTRAAVLARAAESLHPEGAIVLGAGETIPEAFEGFGFDDGVIRRGDAARRAA